MPLPPTHTLGNSNSDQFRHPLNTRRSSSYLQLGAAVRAYSVLPEILEPRWRQLGVAHCVLNIPVAEVSLQGAGVVALVSQGKTAGVPQHMRMGLEGQLGLPARPFDHAGEASRAERCPAFRGKHEGRLGFLFALKPPQRPQFVPEDWVGAWGALFDPADVQGGCGELHLIPAQVHQLRDPQAMPVG
jgi:hypothetical protein